MSTRRGAFYMLPCCLASPPNCTGERCSPLHLLHGGCRGRRPRRPGRCAYIAGGYRIRPYGPIQIPHNTQNKHPQRITRWGCLFSAIYQQLPPGKITPRCSRTAGTSSRRGCARCPSERGSAARSRCSRQRGCRRCQPSAYPRPRAASRSG